MNWTTNSFDLNDSQTQIRDFDKSNVNQEEKTSYSVESLLF